MRHVLWIAVLLALVAGGCGGGSGGTSGEPAFPDNLRPSLYLDGDYEAADLTGYAYRWDTLGGRWEYIGVSLESVALTLRGNGLAGSAEIVSLRDLDGMSHTTPGDTVLGLTVGETLLITGHVDGGALHMSCQNAPGVRLRFVLVPYDATVDDWTLDLRMTEVTDFEGVSDTDAAETRSSGSAEMGDFIWLRDPTSSPAPTSPGFATGNSVYADGEWSGDGTTYMAYYDVVGDDFEYSEIDYDIDVTFAGNGVSGTAVLVSTGDLADLDGYVDGANFTVTGRIAGATVFLEFRAADGSLVLQHILSPEDLELGLQESPGNVTSTYSQYGVTYSTPTTYGGESEIELTRE